MSDASERRLCETVVTTFSKTLSRPRLRVKVDRVVKTKKAEHELILEHDGYIYSLTVQRVGTTAGTARIHVLVTTVGDEPRCFYEQSFPCSRVVKLRRSALVLATKIRARVVHDVMDL